MKKVSFGENKVLIVENISKYLLWSSSFISTVETSSEIFSYLREVHTEKSKLELISNTCEILSDHEDVYHVDIFFNEKNEEKFITHLINFMEIAFNSSKSCNVVKSNHNKLYFKDWFSNPSLSIDEHFKIEEHWEI